MSEEKAKVTIFRYNPEEDVKPYYKVYEIPFESGMTVLDALNYVYANYDGSLAYVYGCRYGFCGSCALKVNGNPTLICRELATKEMKIEPLDNFPVIRDLVIDREGFEGKIRGIRPFLERVIPPDKESEFLKPADFETFRLVSRCVGCFACVSSCPVTTADSYKFPGPYLLTELARYAFDPRDEGDRITTAYLDGLYYCAGCRKCEQVCPYEISVPKLIIEPLREQAVSVNIEPPTVKEEVKHILSTGNALSTLKKDSLIEKLPPLEEAKDEIAKVVFFVGCYVDQDFRLHQEGKSAIEILKRNKISVAIPKDQVCCGRPLLEAGENKKVEELVRKNVLAIESTGIREVVTVCPGCGLTLKEDYPLIFSRIEGRKPNFEVYDFSEYLLKKVKLDGKLHKLDLEVTYHDPCHLNRGQGIHEQPRQIINCIPGVKLVEMEEPDRCCGGGGVIKAIDNQLAQTIAKRKAEMIKNLNVKAVITPCPICVLQIKQGLKLSKVRGVKVMHLTELLDKAL